MPREDRFFAGVRRRLSRGGYVTGALILAILLMLGSLAHYTHMALGERLYAATAILEGGGYTVALSYPRELPLTDPNTRGALISARLQATPTAAPDATATPTAAPDATATAGGPPATATGAPPTAETPAAGNTAAEAETPAAGGAAALAPTAALALALRFEESEALVFTDGQGQPAAAGMVLTSTLDASAVGSTYVRPANSAAAAGARVPLELQLVGAGEGPVDLAPTAGEQPAIQIESRVTFWLTTFLGRLFGDQAVLFGLALAVIGWAIDALRRNNDTLDAARKERFKELCERLDSDPAAAVSDYRRGPRGELPWRWTRDEDSRFKNLLAARANATLRRQIVGRAGAYLSDNQDLRCCQALDDLGYIVELERKGNHDGKSAQPAAPAGHAAVLQDALKQPGGVLQDTNRASVVVKTLFDLVESYDEAALELCAQILSRLLGAAKTAQEPQQTEAELEQIIRTELHGKQHSPTDRWRKRRLLLRHTLVRSEPVVVRVDGPLRDPGPRPILLGPAPETAPTGEAPVRLKNRRGTPMPLGLAELQLEAEHTAKSLYASAEARIREDAAPLMLCEPALLQRAVAEQIVNGASIKSLVAFLTLDDAGLPGHGADTLPALNLVVHAVCEAWWQLLCAVPDTLLDLEPAEQRPISSLLVAQAGSADAFAARLRLGIAEANGGERGIFEQFIVRSAGEAAASRRTPRLSRGELLTALAIRPKLYQASTLVLVKPDGGPDVQRQAEQLLRLAPTLARERVYLRFFLDPEPPAFLQEARVARLRWPQAELAAIGGRLLQRAAGDTSLEYAALREWNAALRPLDELVADADGSPTRLAQLLRAALRAAAVPGPAPEGTP